MPSILKGNNSIISGNTTFTVRPTFANNTPWDTGNLPVQALGQCRLVWTSSTVCTLKPFNGNQLFIGGVFYTIPSAGITISNAGLSASTLYYIYAYPSGNNIILQATTVLPSTDPTWGHQVVASPFNTLVGMVYNASDSKFYDTPALRLVASYFNRRPREMYQTSTNGSTASTSFVEINAANRVSFVSWGDTSLIAYLVGLQQSNFSAYYTFTYLMLDGGTIGGGLTNYNATGGANYALSLTASVTPSEGFHYIGFLGSVNAQTGIWSAAIGGSVII